jgi:mercuric reductase
VAHTRVQDELSAIAPWPRTHSIASDSTVAAAFAAITEASDRELSTAMVNTGLPVGGTCVNVGCVPSKHLLALGETAATPRMNPFDAVQYSDGEPTVDWAAALDGTDELVEQFRQSNYVDVAEHFATDETVGAHMVGPRAADMITEATLAVTFGLTVDDIVDTVHPFPTFGEAFN